MVWDENWDSDQELGHATKGHGDAWEQLNNQLLLEWQRFNKRLSAAADEREEANKPLTQAERAQHVARFRDALHERYGCSAVDQRWESERAKRLQAREQPTRRQYAP